MKYLLVKAFALIMISLCGKNSVAQLFEQGLEMASLPESLSGYISYQFEEVRGNSNHKNFFPVTVHSMPVKYRILERTCPQGEKYYRISDNGEFEYAYKQDTGNDSALHFKTITSRTFYLETKRKGHLSEDISFREFMQLSLHEQRHLLSAQTATLDCYEYDLVRGEAKLSYTTSTEGLRMFLSNDKLNMELVKKETLTDEDNVVLVKFMSEDRSASFNVKALTQPIKDLEISSYADYLKLVSVWEQAGEKIKPSMEQNFSR